MANFQRRLVAAGLCAALGYIPNGVIAQNSNVLEEIIVTARKREESILKVPVVVTALTDQQIKDYAIDDLYKVADMVPGLLINNNVLGIGAQVSLRGVGTSVFDPTIDQSISLIVDGMQMTQGTAYQAAFFDIQQVEVLKGPQALFFGKASPGGVINITTADPGDEFEVLLKAGYEQEARSEQIELALSGPITDTLGVRLAAQYTDSDGYFKNDAFVTPANEFTGAKAPNSRNLQETETFLGRLTVVWEPTDRFRGRLKYTRTDTEIQGDAGAPQLKSCPDGIRTHPTGLAFIGNNEDCKFDDTFSLVHLNPEFYPGLTIFPGYDGPPGARNNGVPYTDHQQDFGTLELDYSFTDSLLLTSVTGFYDTDQSAQINASGTSADGTLFGVNPDFGREDFTQEIRLTSDFQDSSLNFMLGAFYHDGEMNYFNNLPGNIETLMVPQVNLGTQDIDIEAKSVFGQILWDVTDTLELTAGGRWTDEERKHTVTTWVCQPFSPIPWPIGCERGLPVEPSVQPTVTPKISSDNFSPEVTAAWTPSDDITYFAAFKQAYKSGSFNTVTVPNPYIPGVQEEEVSYGDEKIKGWEAGIKARWLDGQLFFNAAYYDYDYEDMQVGANDNTGGVVSIVTQNAASSTIRGVEADFIYSPFALQGLTLRGAFNWNDAEFENYDNAVCWGGQSFEEGCNQIFDPTTGLYNAQDLGGKPLDRAPDYTANLGADFEWPMFRGGVIARLSGTLYYSDEYSTSLIKRRDVIQDSYTKTNLSISLRDADNAWEIALIGNNINDELTTGTCNPSATEAGVFFSDSSYGFREPDLSWAQEDELICTPDKGREIWLQLTLRPMSFFGT